MARRRLMLVATALTVVAANALAPGASAHRLPYLLAVLAVLFLLQAFWEERTSRWLTASTGIVMAALLASITYSLSAQPSRAVDRAGSERPAKQPGVATTAATPTTATPTSVETKVAGAVEERPASERLARCETALAQIAAVIRAAGGTVDERNPTAEQPVDARLRACQVRLDAIAASLPR